MKFHYLDIIDCNMGDHGKPFATNFNPKSSGKLRPRGKFWENGDWKETNPLSVNRMFDFPAGIGPKKISPDVP